MSLYRRAPKRDASEKAIVDVLKKMGWSVEGLSIAGGPDLLIGRQGKTTLLVEVKTGKAKLRKAQEDWHASWRGVPVVVLRTPEDAIRLTHAQHTKD